jgi:parvulin-like peptidyl-prolyl isomerase
MKTTENPLEARIENSNIQNISELDTPLKRLSKNTISGEEIVELLDRYGLLPQLQRELIIDAELESIDCTNQEIFDAGKAFYRQQQIKSEEDRTAWLKRNHFTLDRLEHLLIRTIKLDRFKHQTFASKVDSYFLQQKDRLDLVSYSLLRVKDVHLAQELFFRIRDEEATFAALAQQYSGGQEAENSGSIGLQSLSKPHPDLARKLRLLKPGQLAPPFQIADWFIIVRLEQYVPAQLDEKMRSRSIEELYNLWVQTKINTLNRDLRC